ncbi:MAG TPA: hypothetical protein VFM52_01180, partial [Rhodanobacter sp.]|nr:hypothetical protein [Rhodanobacter sp.]
PSRMSQWFASCPKGLEYLLRDELVALGAEDVHEALAALEIPVAGLFLLATPPAIPGVAQALDVRAGVPAMLVHGWRDEVCPVAPVQAFAAARRLPLLLVDDDHRLGASLDLITAQFVALLGRLA